MAAETTPQLAEMMPAMVCVGATRSRTQSSTPVQDKLSRGSLVNRLCGVEASLTHGEITAKQRRERGRAKDSEHVNYSIIMGFQFCLPSVVMYHYTAKAKNILAKSHNTKHINAQ